MRKVLVVNSKGGCGKTTIATNLAAAMAARGEQVALADADRQKSSVGWLKRRSKRCRRIDGLNWTKREAIGGHPKNLDAIIIDGPGGLRSETAKKLVAEASDIVVPVMPSAFDWNSTLKFLNAISEIKRVRKGKADIHLVANRINRRAAITKELEKKLAKAGHPPLAEITDRVCYARHAQEGTSIFDYSDAQTAEIRSQWHPLLQALD